MQIFGQSIKNIHIESLKKIFADLTFERRYNYPFEAYKNYLTKFKRPLTLFRLSNWRERLQQKRLQQNWRERKKDGSSKKLIRNVVFLLIH